jgi:hypothetical protein
MEDRMHNQRRMWHRSKNDEMTWCRLGSDDLVTVPKTFFFFPRKDRKDKVIFLAESERLLPIDRLSVITHNSSI